LKVSDNDLMIEKELPFFSVIVPTYNRAHSIAKAVQSILDQTFIDFEIIVVDDASTDGTKEVINSITDHRVRYIRNETNLERCLTRNKGIEIAKGKYIFFLDSDDYHLQKHLDLIYKEIQHQNEPVGFFFTNAWDEDSEGKRSERCCPDFEKFNSYSYFLHYTVNPQRWAVHRNVFEKVKFDSEVIICEDMDTSLRILAAGFPVFQIKERTTIYVAATDSFTMNDRNKAAKELFYLKRIFSRKELKGKLSKSERNRLISMCHFHLAIKSNEEGLRLKTYRHSILSFFLFPRGYNGKTNKILFVMTLYSLPVIGNWIKSVIALKKHYL
jgi:glycosyltransferase involved in cell wall biosynthesis